MDGMFNEWGRQMQPLMQPAIWIGGLALVVGIVFTSLMKFVGSGRRQRGLERVGRGMLFEVMSWFAAVAWTAVLASGIVVFLGFYLVRV